MAWAAGWPERIWAVEGASGLGYLLAQQLVVTGEHVFDVQPKLGARLRLLVQGEQAMGLRHIEEGGACGAAGPH